MPKKKTTVKPLKWLACDLRDMIVDFILSAVQLFLYIYGGRGVGKTYTTQKTIIDYCLTNHKEFGLLVPTVEEKKTSMLKAWTEKVLLYEFTDWETKATSDYLYMRKNEEDDWQRVAYCIPLNKAGSFKKKSMSQVDFLIWDESVEIPGNMSMEKVLEDVLTAYHTIDRDENRVKLIMLSNFEAGDKRNMCLFDFFDVSIKDQQTENSIVESENKKAWHIPMADDIKEDPNNKFRRMIKGTKYGDKADGIFRTDYGNLLVYPEKTDKFLWSFALWIGELAIGLMLRDDGTIFCQRVDTHFIKDYCSRVYTVNDKQISQEIKFVPTQLIEYINDKIKNGKFKFVDEDSYFKVNEVLQFSGIELKI